MSIKQTKGARRANGLARGEVQRAEGLRESFLRFKFNFAFFLSFRQKSKIFATSPVRRRLTFLAIERLNFIALALRLYHFALLVPE